VKDTTKRILKDKSMGLLVVLALVVVFFVAVGALTLARHKSCDRLDAARVSHLQPGRVSPGPGSIYVKGIGTDQSEIMQYLEAEAAMDRAGC
jgi:hypothetical protein